MSKWVTFDTETTGISVDNSRIVQFAYQHIAEDGAVKEGSMLLNPTIPIEPGASKVHGYTDDMVKGYPTFKSVGQQIFALLDHAYWIVYNGVRFDIPLLKNEFARAEMPVPKSLGILDGYKIFLHFHGNPRKRGARTLTAAHQFYCNSGFENAHDALADVRATSDVVEAQLKVHKTPIDNLVKISEKIPNEIDHRGVFRWNGTIPVMGVGKYRGFPLQEVPPGYFQWMASNKGFSPDAVQIAKNALKGFFPVKPVK